MRGDDQLRLTRGQLAALGVTSLSLAILTFFLGVQVARLKQPEPVQQSVQLDLITADVESDALTELLARVEAAASVELPEAQAAHLSFPERLVADVPEVNLPEVVPELGEAAVVEPPLVDGPAAPELEPVDTPTEGWAVQLWSFPDPEQAQAKLDALSEAGQDAYRIEALVRGETWYRVRVGPYSTKEKALAAMPALAEAHGVEDPIVTPVR